MKTLFCQFTPAYILRIGTDKFFLDIRLIRILEDLFVKRQAFKREDLQVLTHQIVKDEV